jgi:NAD(P)H-dependent FMN reductase
MHIALISGSHRIQSQSARIAEYLAARLPALDATLTTDIISLAGNPLPLWNETMWQAGSDLQKQWEPYGKRLSGAQGLVVISPEWHGMVPAGLKNFFLYASAEEVGHKPGLIVGVSASTGGAYPVQELRISSYKNNMLCYIPQHLIIRNVEKIFVGDMPVTSEDGYMRGRADFALRHLIEYTKALATVRASGVVFDKKYANGM